MHKNSPTSHLKHELDQCHQQSERINAADFPAKCLESLQHFQRARLAQTYADLAAQARYAPAVQFFLAELYGGLNIHKRNQQLAKVLPIMSRLLPGRMLDSLAEALRLQWVSLALDSDMALALATQDEAPLTEAGYAQAYRSLPRSLRQQQIELIERLALDLDALVQRRSVLRLIKAMRLPAKKAGFAAMQGFLERGLVAFRAMDGAQEFTAVIKQRELQIMEQLYAGAPDPFKVSNRSQSAREGVG